MTLTLFATVIALLFLGVPVAFALMGATALALLVGPYPGFVLLKEMFSGIDSFPLLAIPFFVLAAELMSGGKLTTVLLHFASQLVGHLRGGLGYANVLALTV